MCRVPCLRTIFTALHAHGTTITTVPRYSTYVLPYSTPGTPVHQAKCLGQARKDGYRRPSLTLPRPPPFSPRTISAYGEIMTILVQNIIIVVLLWCYMKDRPSALGIAGLVAVFLGTTVGCAMLPNERLVLLPYSNLPLIIVAKVPQVTPTMQAVGSSAVVEGLPGVLLILVDGRARNGGW